ncbi:MAG: DNA polymerase I [Rhodospirillaceae bacterium]|nr:DNA polymerase I [Rhodospirillaceae bacterium]|tara:strand:- start:1792 stop:4509 length:2718 start_codon:yes stop_codon:yes gene_type:complete
MKDSTKTSKESTDKPFVLVDGSSYLFRAYHALPAFTSSKGEPTGAIFGVLNMLYKLLDDFDPERIAVVFDAPGKTFRNDLFPDYKANRPSMPEDLRPQIAPLLEAIEAIGLPVLQIVGVEADDVIGTLASKASEANISTLISTSDKDMAQLVSDQVTLVNTMSDTILDAKGVYDKFGVWPEQIVDYLALVGDTSDNVPGVQGVGPKTAVKWLAQYNDLKTIVSNAHEISGKVGERLRETLESLPLYKELVTIVRDVSLSADISELLLRKPDRGKLQLLYEQLELRTLLKRVKEDATDSSATKIIENEYETIFTEKQLDEWLKKIKSADVVAIDTETTSLNYMDAEIVGISFATEISKAAYIPLTHRYTGAPKQLNINSVLKKLQPWLESDSNKVGHNLKYDTHILLNHGIRLRGNTYDSMLESFIFNSTATRHDMDSVASEYLNRKTIKYEEVAGKGAKQIGFDQVDISTATNYAAEDADITLQIHQHLWPKVNATPKLKKLYQEIEQPLIKVLQKMEYAGVLIDSEMLRKQSQELANAMTKTESKSHSEAKCQFNLSSPKQLQEILFEQLKLPILGKTPKGQPSTAESVLQELAIDYELPKLILKYRSLSKLKSTYTDKLPLQINTKTGRIHTSYHQAVAATGRLSSSDPNLQNIPIRTEEGRKIRQAFIASPGYQLLAADYSQIELRIMAHLSQDDGLLSAFKNDQDIHRATASEVFGVEMEKISVAERRSAKAINFGLIYGMSAFGLAKQLGIERSAAQEYVDLYFARYPGVKNYMDETRKAAQADGFVSTIFGRRLFLPEINSKNHQRRQYAERSAINAPMQGTAADIIKRAMISVDEWIEKENIDARLIMQVHDELVLEVNKNEVETCTKTLASIMENAAILDVKLKVDSGLGSNWDEAH